MFRKVLPFVCQASNVRNGHYNRQARSLWDAVRPPTEIQRLVREMDRQLDAFDRAFFNLAPFRYIAPRLIPIEGAETKDKKFRLNVDISGFQPEDIKISMKDKILKIDAKMEKTNGDGSSILQHMVREFSLPQNIEEGTIDAFVNGGTLTLEAVTKDEGMKRIKINGSPTAEKIEDAQKDAGNIAKNFKTENAKTEESPTVQEKKDALENDIASRIFSKIKT